MHLSASFIVLLTYVVASTACYGPNVNQATVNIIKLSEGLVRYPTPDPIKLSTVGYGHKCLSSGCSEVPYSFPLNDATASALMFSDLRVHHCLVFPPKRFHSYLSTYLHQNPQTPQNCIQRYISSDIYLNENQYGALVSWAFNEGCGNAASSSLIRRINNGEDPDIVAAYELPRWNLGGGRVLPGLVVRRQREVNLLRTYSDYQGLPAC